MNKILFICLASYAAISASNSAQIDEMRREIAEQAAQLESYMRENPQIEEFFKKTNETLIEAYNQASAPLQNQPTKAEVVLQVQIGDETTYSIIHFKNNQPITAAHEMSELARCTLCHEAINAGSIGIADQARIALNLPVPALTITEATAHSKSLEFKNEFASCVVHVIVYPTAA